MVRRRRLNSGALHLYLLKLHISNGFSKEGGLALFRLDQDKGFSWSIKLDRDRRRTSAGAQVKPHPDWIIESPRDEKRFYDEAVECLVGWILQRESCEVDSRVPTSQ